MLNWLSSRAAHRRRSGNLYGAVVTAARAPTLYRAFGLADTPEGRYEAVVVHLYLLLERMRTDTPQVPPDVQPELKPELKVVSREVLEAFVDDIHDNFREMGVGDLAVPRKVKKAAAAFYDRAADYRAARDKDGSDGFAEVLRRHLPAAPGQVLDAAAIMRHLEHVARVLEATPDADLMAGRVTLPEPAVSF